MDGDNLNHNIISQDQMRAEHAVSAAQRLVIVSVTVQILSISAEKRFGSFTSLDILRSSFVILFVAARTCDKHW